MATGRSEIRAVHRRAGLLWALLSPSLANAACPATPDQVATTARRTSEAFAAMDPDGLATARTALVEELTCLTAPPSAEQAAAIYEAMALSAFLAKDTAATVTWLHSMHEADPSRTLSGDVAPAGGLLYKRDVEARALPPSMRQAHPLADGWTLVADGRADLDPPMTRKAVLVIVDPGRAVAWSGLASAGEIPQGVGARAEPSSKKHRPAVPLFIAAGGSALVSGGLWLAFAPGLRQLRAIDGLPDAGPTDDDWAQAGLEPMTPDEVDALWERTRKLEIAAQATTGLAIGFGTVGLVVAW